MQVLHMIAKKLSQADFQYKFPLAVGMCKKRARWVDDFPFNINMGGNKKSSLILVSALQLSKSSRY